MAPGRNGDNAAATSGSAVTASRGQPGVGGAEQPAPSAHLQARPLDAHAHVVGIPGLVLGISVSKPSR